MKSGEKQDNIKDLLNRLLKPDSIYKILGGNKIGTSKPPEKIRPEKKIKK